METRRRWRRRRSRQSSIESFEMQLIVVLTDSHKVILVRQFGWTNTFVTTVRPQSMSPILVLVLVVSLLLLLLLLIPLVVRHLLSSLLRECYYKTLSRNNNGLLVKVALLRTIMIWLWVGDDVHWCGATICLVATQWRRRCWMTVEIVEWQLNDSWTTIEWQLK